MGPQSWGQGRAAIVIPTWGGPSARFPVVVALHGRGEALKEPAEGAMGWPRDYALLRAIDRLHAPPLREADYEGLADPVRMNDTNASLAARPFGGVITACPWLPDLRPAATADIAAYSRFVVDTLLPRVRRETPALSLPEATGIDGVSLGGVTALRIGLTYPECFAAVGGIQPALSEGQNAEWTALARAARATRPALRLRLLTSHEDYFHAPIIGLSQAWRAAGVAHDFADVPGPHDYVFNRGPGSLELLLWHDRVLSRA
ncbi:MAG: alpha/beta hydrolase-fold protein [Myxococcota bacterium]|nr:alpha/beta hydrolase-fold protein [Myxococcota bacterium]